MNIPDNTILLRPLTMKDFQTVLKWGKDESFCTANGWELNRSEKKLYSWWNRCVFNEQPNFIRLGIEFQHTLIGYADLADIHPHTAELGIAIGESNLWGKGIGRIAAQKMITYGMEHLDIHQFHAETHVTNYRAQKMLKKIGFQEESRLENETSSPYLPFALHKNKLV
ncbi:GNAT family N-acetyltransferase [Oceanobacillus jeddahense]|uniref:GNAT family N-acetyltransferase n=1 Tax=Oceanobacillus jeddahense TaxID=1462527 RepID=A0ABY5JXR5_9BACI|nr:GNAT family N-acetyltransferase [Oceanobacillus jeddahense]UUI03836.1 GNAT family N-acetyltransferase [Oceanobacillus jeddahense]